MPWYESSKPLTRVLGFISQRVSSSRGTYLSGVFLLSPRNVKGLHEQAGGLNATTLKPACLVFIFALSM